MKSTIEQIRQRFDTAVDQFSNLQTGQSAVIDAPFCLELVTQAAATLSPNAKRVLDVGCGAGNYALKLLELLPNLDVTLIDLSRPMLKRAVQRVQTATTGEVLAIQADIREVELHQSSFDLILAGSVLHHLRQEFEWKCVFHKFYRSLQPHGSLWIVDLVEHAIPCVREIVWKRYHGYLKQLGGEQLAQIVATEIAQQDTPQSLLFQLDLLREVGFEKVEILHKHLCYAAFGAIKSSDHPAPDQQLPEFISYDDRCSPLQTKRIGR